MKKSTFALNVYIWYMGSFIMAIVLCVCQPLTKDHFILRYYLERKKEECGEEVDR